MNIDNINRVIAAVRDEPHHFKMADWISGDPEREFKEDHRRTLARGNPCNTAGCLGGWMDSLALTDIADGKMKMPTPFYEGQRISPTHLAAAFVGLEAGTASLTGLFQMEFNYSLTRFDKLPDDKRAAAGARALEIFRDNGGKSDWTRALKETGLYSYMMYETDTV